jgi:hypothetical protein
MMEVEESTTAPPAAGAGAGAGVDSGAEGGWGQRADDGDRGHALVEEGYGRTGKRDIR